MTKRRSRAGKNRSPNSHGALPSIRESAIRIPQSTRCFSRTRSRLHHRPHARPIEPADRTRSPPVVEINRGGQALHGRPARRIPDSRSAKSRSHLHRYLRALEAVLMKRCGPTASPHSNADGLTVCGSARKKIASIASACATGSR